ncbi:APC family permease [Allokutzneria sp. NRRL B-24872]|uniref:APC family permease n=1 Tax=Allokutzneria sp. NRRL B-24872 TaxID=1137961 RepID=UPI00143D5D41|nr:APC family permease [Allokutzneria sp. NRRL B-24872]
MSGAGSVTGSVSLSGKQNRRPLGVADLVFFVVAASAPLTVAAGGVPQVYAATGVLGLPVLYLVLAVVLAVFSAGYAAMSRHIVDAGAFSAYVAEGLGARVGTGAATVALIAYNSMQVSLYGLFGVAASGLLAKQAGWTVPWWACALVAMALVAVLGYLRVDLNARVLAVLLLVETVAVVIFDVAELGTGGSEAVQVLSPAAVATGAAGAALCFMMGSFVGFESAAIYGEECRDPRRTVARATYISVAFIGVGYAVTAWAFAAGTGVSGLIGASTEHGPELFFVLAERSVGTWFVDLTRVFYVTSLFAALLSFHNVVARYFLAMGRKGVLPRALGRTHPRHGSPHIGSLAQSGLALLVVGGFALTGMDPITTLFTWLTNVGSLGVIFLLTLTSLAITVFFGKRPRERWWSQRVAPALGTLLLGVILVLSISQFDVLLGL